jgi:hypothetical protein
MKEDRMRLEPSSHASVSSLARLPRLAGLAILALLLLALGACDSTTGSFTVGAAATGTAAANATATSVATNVPASPTAGGFNVKVFFSKHPDSDNNVNAVFSVNRVSPTSGVATYSMQQLIAGPISSEAAAGYYTELHGALSGASNCGGADFQITLNTHIDPHTGTPSAQPGTAVLKFCKTTSLPGDLSGSRITAQINASIKQFSTPSKPITTVQILNSAGHCFNDLSGQDNC